MPSLSNKTRFPGAFPRALRPRCPSHRTLASLSRAAGRKPQPLQHDRSHGPLAAQGLALYLPKRYTCDLVYVRDAALGKPRGPSTRDPSPNPEAP